MEDSIVAHNNSPITAVHRIGNHHEHILIQTNQASVKHFMVNRTQRQTVGYFARAMMLLPSDISRSKGYINLRYLAIVVDVTIKIQLLEM
ncbi:hypothetical protein SG76_09900 [Enterobacter hormaechei subsp. steigerwaltii]|nr:hypothetical protein SG76_09900 [Enterobacter hormaechei subsp. steigerwaltii]